MPSHFSFLFLTLLLLNFATAQGQVQGENLEFEFYSIKNEVVQAVIFEKSYRGLGLNPVAKKRYTPGVGEVLMVEDSLISILKSYQDSPPLGRKLSRKAYQAILKARKRQYVGYINPEIGKVLVVNFLIDKNLFKDCWGNLASNWIVIHYEGKRGACYQYLVTINLSTLEILEIFGG